MTASRFLRIGKKAMQGYPIMRIFNGRCRLKTEPPFVYL